LRCIYICRTFVYQHLNKAFHFIQQQPQLSSYPKYGTGGQMLLNSKCGNEGRTNKIIHHLSPIFFRPFLQALLRFGYSELSPRKRLANQFVSLFHICLNTFISRKIVRFSLPFPFGLLSVRSLLAKFRMTKCSKKAEKQKLWREMGKNRKVGRKGRPIGGWSCIAQSIHPPSLQSHSLEKFPAIFAQAYRLLHPIHLPY
jgi:hypothetical protein